MEQPGVVSLWIGKLENTESFNSYFEHNYSKDGNFIPSSFIKDFKIDYFDEDLMEIQYLKQKNNQLENILNGCSHDKIIIPKFSKLVGKQLKKKMNTMILLYNFQYIGKINETKKMKYMGCVKYN